MGSETFHPGGRSQTPLKLRTKTQDFCLEGPQIIGILGLTQEQIQQVNFDKINLSEAFEEYSEDYQEKMDRLQQKIKEGLTATR